MKKSLSAILAASMAFSMFASAAFADTSSKTSEEKFQEMKTAGIFQGYPDGKSHLEETMTRAEFAKALAALLGLEDDSAAASVYSDVAANHWAIGEIGALTAEQIMEGTGAGKFGPKVNVSIEQLAKIVVGAMKLEVKEDATVEGKTSAWATPYVAAAVEAGLISKAADYTILATRGNLVDSSYEVFAKGQISVKSTKVVNAKNIEVTFSDDQVVKKELAEPLKVGVATKVEVEYQGKKYTVEVTLAQLATEAKAAGAKKVEVKLNQTVDTAKAVFEVKRGNSGTQKITKTTYSEDKMTVTLELENKLVDGDYTVTLKEVSETPVTSTFKAENEKLTGLEFVGEKLAVTDNTYSQVAISYRLVNQYNEDVTKQYGGSVTWTPSKGTVRSNVNGKLTIGFLPSDNIKYVVNEQVSLTGIHSSGLTVSKILSVGPEAMVESVTVKEVYNADKKELSMSSNFNEFVLLIEAKDQYGNIMNANDVNDDVIVMVSNPTIFNITQGTAKDDQGPNKDQVGIPLANPLGTYRTEGTNSITFVAKNGGKQTKFDVTISKGATLNTFTLENPEKDVAVGDKPVKIPFYAADANGNQITKFDDLNEKVQFASSAGKFELKKDFATGNAYLEWTVPTQGRHSLSATVKTGSFSTSTIFVDVRSGAVPTRVEGVKDFAQNRMYVSGATATISPSNIVVHDQYQRPITLDANFFNNYVLVVENADSSTDFGGYGLIKSTTDVLTLTTTAAGSDKLSIKLAERKEVDGAVVAGNVLSTKEVTLSFVDKASLSNFAVTDIPKTYYKHLVDVKVTAKNGFGDTVEIPADQFNVTAGTNATVNGKKVSGAGINDWVNNGTEQVKKVNFTVSFNNGLAPSITKEYEVTNIATKVAKVEFKTTGAFAGDNYVVNVTGTNNFTLGQLLNNAITLKDQYGVVIPTDIAVNADFKANANIVSVKKAENSAIKFMNGATETGFAEVNDLTVTTPKVGDSFTVEIIVGEYKFSVEVNIK